jgi:hypothetical protein
LTKREEIDNPNSCLNKGSDAALKFVLDETDVAAPDTVRNWAALRCAKGKNNLTDPQITEALEWADRVERRLTVRGSA